VIIKYYRKLLTLQYSSFIVKPKNNVQAQNPIWPYPPFSAYVYLSLLSTAFEEFSVPF